MAVKVRSPSASVTARHRVVLPVPVSPVTSIRPSRRRRPLSSSAHPRSCDALSTKKRGSVALAYGRSALARADGLHPALHPAACALGEFGAAGDLDQCRRAPELERTPLMVEVRPILRSSSLRDLSNKIRDVLLDLCWRQIVAGDRV